jgi:hypothetical protein
LASPIRGPFYDRSILWTGDTTAHRADRVGAGSDLLLSLGISFVSLLSMTVRVDVQVRGAKMSAFGDIVAGS